MSATARNARRRAVGRLRLCRSGRPPAELSHAVHVHTCRLLVNARAGAFVHRHFSAILYRSGSELVFADIVSRKPAVSGLVTRLPLAGSMLQCGVCAGGSLEPRLMNHDNDDDDDVPSTTSNCDR